MKAIIDVLESAGGSRSQRLVAQTAFLQQREKIWHLIREGRFPAAYVSTGNRKYIGATRRHAMRCDFLLASKPALGSRYATDSIADAAQRDLLFYVLRERAVFPERTGRKFFCCPKCTRNWMSV